jgi:hypothetical protein
MVNLIRIICGKMGGSTSPMGAMLLGMMPLVETKLNEVKPENLKALATLMHQSFERVADDSVSAEDFAEWLRPLAES